MMHILIVAAFAGTSSLAPVSDAPWSSIKATGGAELGRAYLDAGEWYLPTGINFAGVKPGATTLNSGVTCLAVKTSHNSDTVYVTATTSVGMGQAACPAAKIGKIKKGTYSVVYRGPNEPTQLLGQVTFGE
jgi:hypothetical protein